MTTERWKVLTEVIDALSNHMSDRHRKAKERRHPWRGVRAAGGRLVSRSDILAQANPMPESVTDRPTKRVCSALPQPTVHFMRGSQAGLNEAVKLVAKMREAGEST